MDMKTLPGASLVAQGLADLSAGRRTEASLLVPIGSPRLKALGFEILTPMVEHQLHVLLAETDSDSAHSRSTP